MLQDRRGFIIPIPQAIAGIIAMFVGILGVRIVIPIVQPILDLAWNNSMAHALTTVAVYLVIVFLFYIVIYGTITGKKPNILGKTKKGELDEYEDLY